MKEHYTLITFSMNKNNSGNLVRSFTIKINRRLLIYFILFGLVSFLAVFGLQHTKEMYYGYIFPKQENFPNPQITTFTFNPCLTQSYNEDFETFFGNRVENNQFYYNRSVDVSQDELENDNENSVIKDSDDSIIYMDQYYVNRYVRSIDGSGSGYYINYVDKNYRKFLHPMSRCEIEKYKHRVLIYLEATLADFLWVLLFTIVPTLVLYLNQKYKFKIKIQ